MGIKLNGLRIKRGDGCIRRLQWYLNCISWLDRFPLISFRHPSCMRPHTHTLTHPHTHTLTHSHTDQNETAQDVRDAGDVALSWSQSHSFIELIQLTCTVNWINFEMDYVEWIQLQFHTKKIKLKNFIFQLKINQIELTFKWIKLIELNLKWIKLIELTLKWIKLNELNSFQHQFH